MIKAKEENCFIHTKYSLPQILKREKLVSGSFATIQTEII